MFSQSQTTLNTSLTNNLTLPSPHLRLPSSYSTKNTKIHESIASFIYLPPSACQCDYQASHSYSLSISQEKTKISMGSLCKLLNEIVEKLIVSYNILLKTTVRSDRTPNALTNKDIILREILLRTRENQCRWRITEFLNSLAILSVDHPNDLVYRQFYALWSVLPDSPTKLSLQHSVPIQKLLNTIINSSMAYEDQLFLNYLKHDIITSKILEDKDHVLHSVMSKFLNRKCLVSDIMKTPNLMNLHYGLNIEAKDCNALNFEDDSENHEEYSTTSGSSRAANDCHMKTVAETLTASNENCSNMVYELYDGCFFGDLTVTFNPEDKLFLPEDEFQERTVVTESSSHWEKDYYRYSKLHPHESPRRSNYTSYQPKHTEASRKGTFYISYEPKQKEQDVEVVVTKDTVTSATSNTTNFPDVTNINHREHTTTGNKTKSKPSQGTRLTLEIPKVSQQEEKPHSGTSIADKSWEPLSSAAGKQSKASKSSLLPNAAKARNAKNSDKTHDKTQSSKGEKAEKSKKKSSKKEQDKGELKLWDMINVKGKLKTF